MSKKKGPAPKYKRFEENEAEEETEEAPSPPPQQLIQRKSKKGPVIEKFERAQKTSKDTRQYFNEMAQQSYENYKIPQQQLQQQYVQESMPPELLFRVFKIETREFNLSSLLNNESFMHSNEFDFTGLENSTDFTFYFISKCMLKISNRSLIDYEKIYMRGSKYATIWSLHYLNKSFDKSLFDLKDQDKLLDRVAGCDKMNSNLLASFQQGNLKFESDELNLFDSAKVVIINEDNFKLNLIDRIIGKTTAKSPFQYEQIKHQNKNINLYECSESLSDIFLSERNLVILTFNPKDTSDHICNSLIRRLNKIFIKNVIPVTIGLIGISDTDFDKSFLENLSNLILDKIKKLKRDIQTLIDAAFENVKQLKLKDEKNVSYLLSLNEQYELFQTNFHILSMNTSKNSNNLLCLSKLKENIESNIFNLKEEYNRELLNLETIDKRELNELRSFKNPPSGVRLVGEAVALLFNKKAEYDQFLKLILPGLEKFIANCKEYNINFISEYTLGQLKTYIDNPSFNQDSINNFSSAASKLCAWVIGAYNYGKLISQGGNVLLNPLENLKEFIVNNAFFSFGWLFYYQDLDSRYLKRQVATSTEMQSVNTLINKVIQTKKHTLLPLSQFYEMFEHEKILKEYMNDRRSSLPEKIAAIFNAKGDAYYNETQSKLKYVVFNIGLLSKVIKLLSEGSTKSNSFSKIFGDNTPVWTKENLIDKIKQITVESEIPTILNYLFDLKLIISFEMEKNNFIVPIFLIDYSPLDLNWETNFKGHEYKVSMILYAEIPRAAFNELVAVCFEPSKTKQLWNKGFINLDGGCQVLFQTIDSADAFANSKEYLEYSKNIFMDYNLKIENILEKYSIPFKINTNEMSHHPFKESLTKSVSSVNELNQQYYKDKLIHINHNFDMNSKLLACSNCELTIENNLFDIESLKQSYPDESSRLDFSIIKEGVLSKSSDNGVYRFEVSENKSVSYKPTRSMDLFSFNGLNVKILNNNYGSSTTALSVEISVIDKNSFKSTAVIYVQISKNAYAIYSSSGEKFVDLIETKYNQMNSPKNTGSNVTILFTGDVVGIKLKNISSDNFQIVFELDNIQVAAFLVSCKIDNLISIVPEVKIEPNIDAGYKQDTLFMISSQFFTETIDHKTDCTLSPNPRAKIFQMKKHLKEKRYEIVQMMNIEIDTNESGKRGLCILPTDYDPSDVSKQLPFYLSNDQSVHMFCLNYENLHEWYEKLELKFLYCHFLDTKGISIKKTKLLNKNLLLYIILSSYFLATAENTTIVPHFDELFPNYPKENQSILDLKLREYFMNVFESLCMFFSTDLINQTGLTIEIKDLLKQIPEKDKNKNEYEIVFKCMYCQNREYNSFRPVSVEEKLNNKYTNCAMKFCHKNQSTSIDIRKNKNEILHIDRKFIQKFSDIIILGAIHTNLTFDTDLDLLSNTKLVKLQMQENQLEFIPKSIFNINSLKSLEISFNPITNIFYDDSPFSNLINLEVLELNRLKLTDLNGEHKRVKLSSKIRSLNLTSLPLNYLPFDLRNNTSSLKELVFSGIPWFNIETNKTMSRRANLILSKEEILNKLNWIFQETESLKLYNYFDATKRGYLEADEINKLNAFIFKKLPRLGDSNNYAELGGITLDIFQLNSLVQLNLSYQAIKFIPDQIELLINLENLILNDCILLETISTKLGLLNKLVALNINECISLKTPPPEIVKRGFASIMSYLKRLSTGSVQCKRTKLMLVGLGEAGKTSLLNALIKNKSNKRPDLTDGIDIKEWTVDLGDKSQLVFSMWDFAGQSVYYNTHQFFLTSRAVYLLVWNVRLGSEYAGLDFWLSSISCHAIGAPIFVVGTHIDEVSKYSLNEQKLKSKFKQIVGFHYVSSITQEGIETLTKELINTTLLEKYIGEAIPEVWLTFEKEVKKKSKERALISYSEISEIASSSGIFESKEVLESVRFLNDLGSLQYFENDSLKDKVIINPQWIVDVMACVVSVKDSSIKDGRLYHKDLLEIWKNYDQSFHSWMLYLTEIFDLTFPVAEQKMNIVPCLLPDKEPHFDWPDITQVAGKHLKEFKVIYNFVYLPAGLFNRIQVRLFQYGDSSVIWKNGSFLKKNNHLALLYQTEVSSIEIKVQGIKPENLIFIIHEVIETLINESFHGIKYDYSFPCPECVEAQSLEPCLFSSLTLRRAFDLKAPFLQCNKFFHAISINEMLAVMPIEGASSLDLNLDYSIRGIKQIRNNLKYDIFFWYCDQNLVQETEQNACDPLKVIDLVKKHYKIWSTKNPKEEKIDRLIAKLKESKLVILGISDEFAKDELSIKLFELVKNILKKNYVLVEFGYNGKHDWLSDSQFASVCSDYRVIMQNPKRFKSKMNELFDAIEKQIEESKKENKIKEDIDVFISYRWSNSHEAVQKGTIATKTSLGWLDPRSLVDYFKQHGISAWIDILEASNSSGLFGEITKGLNEAKLIVACLSDEYCVSQNCLLEFRFAHCSLKKPMIKCIVGLGNEYKKHEISFLGSSYPEVNFQFENPNAYGELLDLVKKELDKCKTHKEKESNTNDPNSKKKESDQMNAAMQELYELTQRKFLKQLIQYSSINSKPYPRLIFIDMIESTKENRIGSGISGRESRNSLNRVKTTSARSNTPVQADENSGSQMKECFKLLCENEDGWHPMSTCILVEDNDMNLIISKYGSYLARIMNFLKYGYLSSELKIFLTAKGRSLLNEIDSYLKEDETQQNDKGSAEEVFRNSYVLLRDLIIEKGNFIDVNGFGLINNEWTGLQRCELKNGKILWLCEKHIRSNNARILNDSIDKNFSFSDNVNTKASIINELESIKLDII